MKEVKELLKSNGEYVLVLVLALSGIIMLGCVLGAEIIKAFNNCG